MSKFKTGNDIVRVVAGASHAPKGYVTKVLKGYKYRDKDGDLAGIVDSNWEPAEEAIKPATVIHNGQSYELNKKYLFSDDGDDWREEALKSINSASKLPFRGRVNWKLIKAPVPAEFGTITPVPVKLDNGKAYMFDLRGNNNFIGLYDDSSNSFYYIGGIVNHVKSCTNIRPLTLAEVK